MADSPILELQLSFSALTAQSAAPIPMPVTGVSPTAVAVSGGILRSGVHYEVTMKGVSATDVVNALTVRVAAIGAWPGCGDDSITISIKFSDSVASPASSNYAAVEGSNTIYVHWQPGKPYVEDCPSPPSFPPPPPKVTTPSPTPAPTDAPTPAPTLRAVQPHVQIDFDTEFPDVEYDTILVGCLVSPSYSLSRMPLSGVLTSSVDIRLIVAVKQMRHLEKPINTSALLTVSAGG